MKQWQALNIYINSKKNLISSNKLLASQGLHRSKALIRFTVTVPRPSSTNFQSENALSRSIFRAVTLKCWSWCLECYNLALTAESQSRRHSSSLVFMNFKNRFKYARNSLFLRSMTTSNYRSFNTASLSIRILKGCSLKKMHSQRLTNNREAPIALPNTNRKKQGQRKDNAV